MKPLLPVLLLLLSPVFPSASAETVRAVEVRVEGGAPVDPSSVLTQVAVKTGAEFDPNLPPLDIRALEETGRFTTVAALVERVDGGVKVIYSVRPRARITRIRVEGADEAGNTTVLEDWLNLAVGDFVDGPLLEARFQRVRAEYAKKHYPSPRLTYDLTVDPATGGASVRVTVEEGGRAKVRDIVFEGNTLLSAKKLREPLLQTRRHWFSWITGSGALDPDVILRDRAAIAGAYRDLGHLDVRVAPPRMDRVDDEGIHVVYAIEEGRPFTIGKVRIQGTEVFSFSQLMPQVRIKSGEVASAAEIEKGRAAIQDYYGVRGYARSRVETSLVPVGEGVVDVVYKVSEGGFFTLRDIRVINNSRTQDKVILRELSVAPGAAYNEVESRKSATRLRNLNYFSYVNLFPEATDRKDELNLVVDVEEQRTGNFLAGVGFSSIENLIGFIEISQGNFNLGCLTGGPFTGGGQKVRARIQAGSESLDLLAGFTEPWFLDRRLTLDVEAYRNDRSYYSDDYDQLNMGGEVGLSFALDDLWRMRLPYTLERIRIYDVSPDASQTIRDEEGSVLESGLGTYFIRDSRNKSFVPTDGGRLSLGGKFVGGPLGADADYYELDATANRFIPLWLEHVLILRGSLKTVDTHGDGERISIFNRLFLGGPRTLRAYKYRKVGPRDEENEATGGRSSLFASAEYTIPVATMIRLAGFYDAGVVNPDSYDFGTSNYSSGAGVGIRFDIPQFPLQFDYGWPLQRGKENEGASGRFSFLIGHTF